MSTFYQQHGKRLLDLIGAMVLAVVIAPVAALIALAIRARLGSPVIFSQRRPGRDGRLFTLYKFRTMRQACDSRGEPLPDAQRLTPLGSFLRAFSLDELPELWNIIRGDMSLVGPRPLLPEYLPLYTPQQARRHDVRPGLTGWAQVNGRNNLLWEEKFNLDAWYVERLSIGVDLKILLLTIGRVLIPCDISKVGHATTDAFVGTPATATPQAAIVLGAGGHAKVVISTLRAAGWSIEAIFDDDPAKLGKRVLGVEVTGPLDYVARMANPRAVIAIGDPIRRREISERFACQWISVVHPAAWLDPSVTLAEGSLVCAGVVIQPDSHIGRHVIVNTAASVDHDCRIDDFAHIGPGAHLAGGVQVGESSLLGTGCSVRPYASIGAGSVIGAGAAVVMQIPPNSLAIGCPARIVRDGNRHIAA